jgi:carboxyl-terminal processing protease
VLPLDAEHAVKLTTARYFTPNGTSIQAAGIQPDIALADLSLSQRENEATPAFGERDLTNHLKGANEAQGGDTPGMPKRDLQDYALNEALNALKALALRGKTPAPVTDTSTKG